MTSFQSVIVKVSEIINLIIPIIIALALVIFLWGIIKYITAGGDEGKRSEARNYIIYGIIGLFVMVAVWGLVKLVGRTVGIEEYGGTIKGPKAPGESSGAGTGTGGINPPTKPEFLQE